MSQIYLTEVALRDGSHVVAHQFSSEQVRYVTKQLSEAGVPYIEVTHGDGLGGSSLQYGFSKEHDIALIRAAAEVAGDSKITVLLIPGIGTIHHLKEAYEAGARVVRVATHVTEADVSKQHIETAKALGMEAFGFLMMSHSASPEKVLEQALLMESYGADAVYVTDSAGAMLPSDVQNRIRLLRAHLNIEIGFHAHNNLSLAVANTLVAIQEGATRIDGSICCLGAGAGNTQTEVLVAVLNRMGIETGIDLYQILDLADYVRANILPHPQDITTGSLVMGYAGVYSSFLRHANIAAEKVGVDARDILVELGKLNVVGGQEDTIIEVAQKIAQQKVGSA
ncbi:MULTISPECIES: 4-hydroxy-2-oxovalerate aldolase [Lysinibacillus]|uniref:4-hydroxy-2-oxovalerate aldolase n=1 Tax=Lysinibacillus fusiformis TaxID=28031 RepID=A0A2I0V2S7_9BACI|nr:MULTISPECIES: 4-hydroxy-2-oxovalerate aldolase [Lysinibacillus]PKU52604.1 4-hydroxy-2-oxovalerate aldolase [Lysinibacillus fusiformis]SCY87557.1 4-hydroxy 2-oxovalerate aldolase [Lysinibacillus sp. SG9]SDB38532.1 4-hydroxy 2-oxovalerate aldolase [Lysinibacillus sp. TC-37]SFT02651.1 4-hydroxy 2-oxovalerate aldolase [Lysinibacillus sp. SG55]